MKPLVLYRHMEKGELKWYPHQGVLYKAFVSKLVDGDTVELKIMKQGRTKTTPQLGYWYGVLVPFAVNALRDLGHYTVFDVSVCGFSTGVKTDKDTVDLLLKTLYRSHVNELEVPLKRNMTTKQMGDLIDFALKWLAENLGVYCPTPEGDR